MVEVGTRHSHQTLLAVIIGCFCWYVTQKFHFSVCCDTCFIFQCTMTHEFHFSVYNDIMLSTYSCPPMITNRKRKRRQAGSENNVILPPTVSGMTETNCIIYKFFWQVKLASVIYCCNFKSTVFKFIIKNRGLATRYVIAPMWMPGNISNGKSALVQVMAWCRQATSHHLSQFWPRSMLQCHH